MALRWAEAACGAPSQVKERKMEIEDLEAYIRSTDGARMIQIKPGWFVNEAVWRKLKSF
jgi:hypothetical protein